ncbi:hypothetical protein [Magnetospirillum fulvum]|uniref:Uncharacterized protein n=1 Tax=Magnetospirillum fulvum MGU-K5 TaxID=1316936 RepID=S9SA16_MAGFU|nr:hypothetical protein [Magnetospirillum fulvum]EPY00918.1 hypothetical protein K678_13558 [Magnetospirillum fulvum MGU-K5]
MSDKSRIDCADTPAPQPPDVAAIIAASPMCNRCAHAPNCLRPFPGGGLVIGCVYWTQDAKATHPKIADQRRERAITHLTPPSPDALVVPPMSPEAEAALIEAWHSAEAKDGPSLILPVPETAEQRRKRRAKIIHFGRFARLGPIAITDAIEASDRAAGCDPDELRETETEISQTHDWARQDVCLVIAERCGFPNLVREFKRLRSECERLRNEWDDAGFEIETLSEKLSAARAEVERLNRVAEENNDLMARANALYVRSCESNATLAAQAMLRVVEAADHWDRVRGSDPVTRADVGDALIDAVRAHRIATGRDALTGEAE